ncbi:hypothetical protein BIW11_12353 [Tropilaelaps mercedesae]|uniref:Uncharacterized protein n=1 Tax=Tropilaelaps mercedesae TaxID=418985 RepID=A0A1V9X6R8_9ACAR|nr:hypothetical protein BIW11_12353 [Tropilaelaps mercedesae]
MMRHRNRRIVLMMLVALLSVDIHDATWSICDIKTERRPGFRDCLEQLVPSVAKKIQALGNAFAEARGMTLPEFIESLCNTKPEIISVLV